MALLSARSIRANHQVNYFITKFASFTVCSTSQTVEDSVKLAVADRTYERIPDILTSSETCCNKQNPFSFLSTFSVADRSRVVDEMLQSFIHLKPHTRLKLTYHYLLTYTLQSSEPFSIALATLQRTLRSGCAPVPQTHLMLSTAWIDQRRGCQSVPDILTDMKSVGYRPDTGTCNFIIKSLCAVDQLEEAVEVLQGMVQASCIPDVESYSTVIAAFCQFRKTEKALTLMKEMVGTMELSPRQGTLVKLVSALRANKEIWRAVEMIQFFAEKGLHVGFESFELMVEGCLECREFILAGKMVMMMTERGYIPYIKIRQKVVQGLMDVSEWQLACAVRHRFAELKS